MKNIKKVKLNRKTIIITTICLIVIILAIILGILFLNKDNQEQKLIDRLTEMGTEFYEDFYYKQIGQTDKERQEFLEKYKDIGIKVNLDSLSRYKKEDSEKILEEFVNSKTEEACDKTNSMVVIYPKEPYGNEDYRIDAILVCGFEETETK